MSTTSGDVASDQVSIRKDSRLRALSVPLSRFFHWWLRELAELVPPGLRRAFSAPRLEVRASPTGLEVVDPTDPEREIAPYRDYPADIDTDHTESPPRAQSPAQRCDLLLAPSLVLSRELQLPNEAEGNLRRVLAFSMDRYTPFTEDEVFFDYKLLRRDRAARKIVIRLFVAPRERVAPVIEYLRHDAIEAVVMDVLESGGDADPGSRAGVNLLAPEQRSRGDSLGRVNRVLAVAALVLVAVAIALPLVQRQQLASRLEGQLAQTRESVRQAEVLRSELDQRVRRMHLIQQRHAGTPSKLEVFDELSRLLPDDAWAGQVAIQDGRVRLSGEAGSASGLMELLSKSPIFVDPRFEAPLTQNPKTGGERFVMSVAIREPGDVR